MLRLKRLSFAPAIESGVYSNGRDADTFQPGVLSWRSKMDADLVGTVRLPLLSLI